MGDRIFGITLQDRLYTADDVRVEDVVANQLIPLVSRYNEEAGQVDYRGLLCENATTTLMQYNIGNTDRLDLMGRHEIPFYKGDKRGAYQHFVKRYGNAVGFDYEFYKDAPSSDYVDKVAKALALDTRRVRHNILRSMLAPQAYGEGFWNRTYSGIEGISSPPTYGTNTFTASHTHYLTTGTATITGTGIFETAKQHIREHGEVNGDWVCFMNSNNINTLAQLATWHANASTITRNPLTDEFAVRGLEKDFELQGINFLADDWVPADYFVLLGGVKNSKPLKFHEDKNPQFRGLQWIPGKNDVRLGRYEITDSYFARLFDVRVYNRWQGVVYQITTNGSYSEPTEYASE